MHASNETIRSSKCPPNRWWPKAFPKACNPNYVISSPPPLAGSYSGAFPCCCTWIIVLYAHHRSLDCSLFLDFSYVYVLCSCLLNFLPYLIMFFFSLGLLSLDIQYYSILPDSTEGNYYISHNYMLFISKMRNTSTISETANYLLFTFVSFTNF